jgi:hypothetical protein
VSARIIGVELIAQPTTATQALAIQSVAPALDLRFGNVRSVFQMRRLVRLESVSVRMGFLATAVR